MEDYYSKSPIVLLYGATVCDTPMGHGSWVCHKPNVYPMCDVSRRVQTHRDVYPVRDA
jgi:hypothetical protein